MRYINIYQHLSKQIDLFDKFFFLFLIVSCPKTVPKIGMKVSIESKFGVSPKYYTSISQ